MKHRNFKLIYYINFGIPSIADSIAMIETYHACGATCFQFDLPTRHPNPEIENDFIMNRMKMALATCNDFHQYLAAMQAVKNKYPEIEIELTLYDDTLAEIGIPAFLSFCKQIGMQHLSLIEAIPNASLHQVLRANGLHLLHPVKVDICKEDILALTATQEPLILLLETGTGVKKQASLAEIKQTIAILRAKENMCSIYATMGIKTANRVHELQTCGVDGVYIGSALIQLWEDQEALKKAIYAFENVRKGSGSY